MNNFIASPQQQAFFDWGINGTGNAFLEAVAGAGKCLGKGTPVLKYDGSIVSVENIKVGDLLMGDDSSPRKVLSLAHGKSNLFKIIPTKGDSWICNDVHILTLMGTNRKNGQIIDIPINEYMEKCKTNVNFKNDCKLYRVSVDFANSNKLPYDPYYIGIWFGDGLSSGTRIWTPDHEIQSYVRRFARSCGLFVTETPEHGCLKMDVVASQKTSIPHANHLRQYLMKYCVDENGTKNIPMEYLTSSRDDRLTLLAGIIDSDGHLARKYYEVTTKHETLANQYAFLARSLGFAAYISKTTKRIKSLNFIGDYYRVTISGNCNEIPCRVERKKCMERVQIKRTNVTGFEIEPQGLGEYYGFTLDGNGRFLLGDFTVTHNTTSLLEFTKIVREKKGNDLKIIIVAYSKKIANELKEKLISRNIQAYASTFHAFGFSAWMFFTKRQCKMNNYKIHNICESLEIDKGYHSFIKNLISLAKNHVLDPQDRTEMMELVSHHDLVSDLEKGYSVDIGVDYAQKVLKESNRIRMSEMDFDDMLYLPVFFDLKLLQHDFVMVDEAQDTNPARRMMASKMVKPNGRLIFVGDRCQPLGTKISVPDGVKNIEEIKIGDKVISFSSRNGSFVQKGRTVLGITKRPYSGKMIVVKSEGKTTRYTPNHYVHVNLSSLSKKHIVYIMEKSGRFRVGKTKFRLDSKMSGFFVRFRQEKADNMWILASFDTNAEALLYEAQISFQYQLPQITFSPVNAGSVWTESQLLNFWKTVNNRNMALRCLEDHNRDVRYPINELMNGMGMFKITRPIKLRAANLMSDALMLHYDEKAHFNRSQYKPIEVYHENFDGEVVSLDVEKDHTYVADGLATYNCQAIFGFTGADADSVDLIMKTFNCKALPLTTTYRCPKSVVKAAQAYVSHIQAHETAPEGEVTYIQRQFFDDIYSQLKKDDAILCRNTAPLVKTAYQLLRKGIACHVEGKDIGIAIKNLLMKWKKIKNKDAYLNKLGEWERIQVERLMKKKKETAAESIMDRCETIRVLAEGCETVDCMINKVTSLFGDSDSDDPNERARTNNLTLSTVHKSKGREWGTVYVLGFREYMPSPMAKQEWEKEQEKNLIYVAFTRAQEKLLLVG